MHPDGDAVRMRVVRLDGLHIRTKRELLNALANALEFPDYFGRNWDALDECLGDIEAPTLVEWSHSDRYAESDPEGYAVALSCFADTEAPVELRLVNPAGH